MSTIRFFFGAPQRLAAAADWLSQARPRNARVVVLCDQADTLDGLDRLLWTRNALGFIPHCRIDSPLAAETPILLTQTLPPNDRADALLNLTDTLPEDFAYYAEVIEVVSLEEAERSSARERFRRYRTMGHTIESINLGEGNPS